MGRKGRAQAGREHTDGTDAPERSRSAPSRRLRQARRGARPAVGLRLLRSSRSIPSTTSTGGYEPPEQIGTTSVSGPPATPDPPLGQTNPLRRPSRPPLRGSIIVSPPSGHQGF